MEIGGAIFCCHHAMKLVLIRNKRATFQCCQCRKSFWIPIVNKKLPN